MTLTSDTSIVVESTIAPTSVEIESHWLETSYNYTLNNKQLYLEWAAEKDSISIKLRTLAYDLGNFDPKLDPADIKNKSRVIKIENDYTQEEIDQRRFISSNKLEYTGSFSRGVNFGNTQDLVLNSNFNLQMNGDLGNGLFVRAAISDDNIPIQPEGNTQVLQEFDKVFIEIQKDSTTVIAGDYELARPESYFMNYYKKLKGLSVSNHSELKKNWRTSNRGSFAISRGKFKRLNLVTQEGNQGPYKLEGDNGEVFLQVLSGTEKVFVDGRLLQRGENRDYVIDYNRAEISFTPNLLITSFTRIIVEYEYSTQAYLRSLYATETSIQNDTWQFDINLYNEQDSKSLASNINLDSTDVNLLEEGGDAPILRSGLFIPEENNFENIIPYTLSDDTLVYSPEAENNRVGARFTNVGANNGSYIIDTNEAANGRIYKYVGDGLGNYDPVVVLTAPEKKQLITGAAKFNPHENTEVFLEGAMSNNDKNRFSQINNSDNVGLALNGGFRQLKKIGAKVSSDSLNRSSTGWTLLMSGQFEYAEANFKALNPYRVPEFQRDWNFKQDTSQNDQLLFNVSAQLANNHHSLKYSFSGFKAEENYDGLRQQLFYQFQNNKWLIQAKASLLNSESTAEKTRFLRPNGLISRSIFNNWNIGARFEKEQNLRDSISNQVLNLQSFNYDLYNLFLSSDESKNFYISAGVTQRTDLGVINNGDTQLGKLAEALDYNLSGRWKMKTNSDLQWNFKLRDYKTFTDKDDPKKTLIGTLDHKLKLFESGLVLNSYYESNSGQEPKVEYQYVKVQKGEGSYLWLDTNMDSIQQLNEFQIAPQADLADFEKVSIFNNEFNNTNKTVLNQSLRLNPKKFLTNKKHFLGRFQITSRYRIDQRSMNEEASSIIQPIVLTNTDSLLSFNMSMDHNLFFNRGNSNYDIQLAYRTLNNKNNQVAGFERRGQVEYYSRSRYNIIKPLDILLESSHGIRDYSSNFGLDYALSYWRLTPQINYRPSTKLRLIAKLKIEEGENDPALGEESAKIRDMGFECTWRKSALTNLQMSINVVSIDYLGPTNTVVELELLQGLKDGNNYLWNINFTRRIGKNFDLILNYNARKSEGAKMVNNAGAQLRAIF